MYVLEAQWKDGTMTVEWRRSYLTIIGATAFAKLYKSLLSRQEKRDLLYMILTTPSGNTHRI